MLVVCEWQCVLLLVLWSNHSTWNHKVTCSNPGARMFHTKSVCLAELHQLPHVNDFHVEVSSTIWSLELFSVHFYGFFSSESSFSLILVVSLVVCFSQRWRWSSGFRRRPVDLETWDQTSAQTSKGRPPHIVCVVCVFKTKTRKTSNPSFQTSSSVAFARGICTFDRFRQSGSWRKQRAGESGGVSWLDKSQLARLVSIVFLVLFSVFHHSLYSLISLNQHLVSFHRVSVICR